MIEKHKKMNCKQVARILDDCYCGIDTIRYSKRFINGIDNKKLNISWILLHFDCSYYVAKKLVERANNFSSWW